MIGSGSSIDPYIITNRADFESVTSGTSSTALKYYALGNDISLGGSLWTPLNVKNISLDGRGFKITGLSVDIVTSVAAQEFAGLFYSPQDSIFKDFIIEGASIKMTYNGTSYWPVVGVVAGRYGSFTDIRCIDCVVTTYSKASLGIVGGIVGSDGICLRCSFTGSVTQDGTAQLNSAAGGIIGSGASTIQYCTVNADVKGMGHVGGIAGEWTAPSTQSGNAVQYCTFEGTVEGVSDGGGIVGKHGSYGYVRNNTSLATSIKRREGVSLLFGRVYGVSGLVARTLNNYARADCEFISV